MTPCHLSSGMPDRREVLLKASLTPQSVRQVQLWRDLCGLVLKGGSSFAVLQAAVEKGGSLA